MLVWGAPQSSPNDPLCPAGAQAQSPGAPPQALELQASLLRSISTSRGCVDSCRRAQLNSALEHLGAPRWFLMQLGPKSLLLAEPWDYSASRALCLLPSSFGLFCSCPLETLSAYEPQLGCLLRLLLGPVPLATPWLLAAQLAGVQPSSALTCLALQALIWGPGPPWAAPCCYCGTDPAREMRPFQSL